MKNLLAVVTLLSLTGCASGFSAITDRAVVENEVQNFTTLAMPADRRIAVFHQDRFCAEALPDIGRSIDAASSGKLALELAEKGKGSGEFTDAFKTALLLAYQRTQTSDVIRQLGWQVCQAHLTGGLTDPAYRELLRILIDRSFELLSKSVT